MKLINPALLDEFRVKVCEWCRKPVYHQTEAAHVLGRGYEGCRRIDHRWNLVALCGPFDGGCHLQHHDGKSPTAAELFALIDKREGLAPGTAETETRRIRALP